MRCLFAGLILLGFAGGTYAQDERSTEIQTIFKASERKVSHGGYAGISVGYTQIDGLGVMTVGARAGWIIDHHVTIGLAGKCLASSVYLDRYWSGNEGYYLVGGYGGLLIEPIIWPKFPVHVSFPVVIGAGGLALNDRTWRNYKWDYDFYDVYDYDYFFVFEPGVEIELNLVRFVRLAIGASYLMTSDVHMQNVPKDMMNGFNGTVTFKFGVF